MVCLHHAEQQRWQAGQAPGSQGCFLGTPTVGADCWGRVLGQASETPGEHPPISFLGPMGPDSSSCSRRQAPKRLPEAVCSAGCFSQFQATLGLSLDSGPKWFHKGLFFFFFFLIAIRNMSKIEDNKTKKREILFPTPTAVTPVSPQLWGLALGCQGTGPAGHGTPTRSCAMHL